MISGQQLPKVANSKDGAIIDPLVRVEIHGVPADQAHQETKYIENNGEQGAPGDPSLPRPCPLPPPSTPSPSPGFNPRWDETLQFQLHVPELALVRFVVEDYDKTSRNDFVGQFTLAFANIKPGERSLPGAGEGVWWGAQPQPCCPPPAGYRHIHLLSKDGTSIPPSSLFVHIRITEPPGPEQD